MSPFLFTPIPTASVTVSGEIWLVSQRSEPLRNTVFARDAENSCHVGSAVLWRLIRLQCIQNIFVLPEHSC